VRAALDDLDARVNLLTPTSVSILGAFVARVPASGVLDLQVYEAAVLPLLPQHGGRLDRRVRSAASQPLRKAGTDKAEHFREPADLVIEGHREVGDHVVAMPEQLGRQRAEQVRSTPSTRAP
jgi:hypothetical protein